MFTLYSFESCEGEKEGHVGPRVDYMGRAARG